MEALHRRYAGLDIHKKTVVASVRLAEDNKVTTEAKPFATTTAGLLALSDWLSASDCAQVAMEAAGVSWKPVWRVLFGWRVPTDSGQCRAREKRARTQDRR